MPARMSEVAGPNVSETDGSDRAMQDAAVETGAGRRGLRQSLTVAALGVVYGDIGTSPLYTVHQSLIEYGNSGAPAVFGAISLIAWSLLLIVSVKYVFVIMRADNRGEGGLLVLTALVLR